MVKIMKNKNMFYILLFAFIVLSITIIYKRVYIEGFQYRNCSSISGCKQCADTRGCTFCNDKCVNNDSVLSQCTGVKVTDSKSCPEVTKNCSDITDCKSCANRLDCSFCSTSNKCVDATKTNQLCPRESIVNSSESCGLTNVISDASDNLYTKNCSSATNCNQCMKTPACYWCSNQSKCVSNINVYEDCMDDKIVTSLSECSSNSGPKYSEDISGVSYSNTPFPDAISENNQISASTTGTTGTTGTVNNVVGVNNSLNFGSMESNISQYPNDSIIPVLGLSRTSNGLLTDSSISIIIDGLKSRGYTLKDSASKNTVLNLIKKESDYYKNMYKNTVSSYVNNSIDNISDGISLNKSRNLQEHIQDLNEVSRYVEAINTTSFTEAYMDLDTEKTKFDDGVQKTRSANFNIELLWLANLVLLGFIFFV